ncbi:MAG: pyridoxine 5'-phosphate synthase [Candidatus Poribacteria bacterium]|nr:pyridoxine 5'-phosphate synthase [Candidatus Poribacteria bacterium]
MINLSVNVNKIATLRNSRGGDLPSVTQAAQTCIDAGAQGITAHPRQDQRHIQPHDVYELAEMVTVEYNIEGDPRPDFLDMVTEICPTQCTLVPVVPGEITSHTVWDLYRDGERLKPIIQRLKDAGIRVSLFSGTDLHQIELSKEVGADRIEFYTEPYASAKTNEEVEHQFGLLVRAAEKAVKVGVGINAGHDLNLDNLPPLRNLPLLEVSIGHHLINDAIYMGLENAVKAYRKALGQKVELT